MSSRSCQDSGSPSGAQRGVDDHELAREPPRRVEERAALLRQQVPVEVRGVHALEAAGPERRIQRVALHERGARDPRGGDVEHPGALVEPGQLAGQVPREEAGPAREVERARRRQRRQRGLQRGHVLLPAGPVAGREQARAEPPVVVLGRPLLVVVAHRRVHARQGYPGEDRLRLAPPPARAHDVDHRRGHGGHRDGQERAGDAGQHARRP